ncbi:MAG: CPBP family intramembrane metalloprotease [Lachnospiraceae bacterium]|nr:CPBP family intramembrane metalloprotease [Lachnospiraceae bacterium]
MNTKKTSKTDDNEKKKTESNLENKKQDGMRLLIYLALSFSLAWLWFFVSNNNGELWEDMSNAKQSLVALGMMCPVTAHILTRLITKEGFAMTGKGSMMLGIVFRDRKWIWFLLAFILPWAYTELGNAIALLISPDMYDPTYYQSLDVDSRILFLMPVNALITGVVGSFAAFGEEGGWRGYMMPKLFKIMGRVPALLCGGIIWGLWHAPLTCIGHNFGTDYPGFPYVGIVQMCIFCTLVGVLLTYLTEKSGSVWPAAFMHAIGNASPTILQGFINPDKAADLPVSAGWAGMLVSLVLVSAVFLFILKKHPGTSLQVQHP